MPAPVLGRGPCLCGGFAFIFLLASGPAAHAEQAQAVFSRECGTCHAAEPGAPARQGPNLFGVIGRQAGSQPGFPYSKGLKQAGFSWSPERLDAYLSDPQAMLPDSYMAYRQPDPGVRAELVSYLASLKAP